MSRPSPPRQKAYPQYRQPPSHPYYYEDAEGYVGDYSESDGLSDSGTGPQVRLIQRGSDVAELHRRKNGTVYRQNAYIPAEYFYEQAVPAPHVKATPVRITSVPVSQPVNPVYNKHVLLQPHAKYYPADELAYQQPAMYHASLPHVAAVPRQAVVQRVPSASAVRHPQQPQVVRRHPVTVRTPRYVRRPPTGTLYKRPSALCLPIACQQDPATCSRRTRRIDPGIQQDLYPVGSRVISRRHSMTAPPMSGASGKPKKVESKKSLDLSKSRLDAILERYEKIFGNEEQQRNLEPGDQEFIKNLKPRIPPCLKESQSVQKQPTQMNITKQQIPEIMRTAETFEVEEITSDVLDELLSELTEHGFNEVFNEQAKKAPSKSTTEPQIQEKKIIADKCDAELTTTAKNSQADLHMKDSPKSFNYKEIKENLVRLNQMSNTSGSETEDTKSHTSRPEVRSTSTATNNMSRKSNVASNLDVEDAMQLHRTKSYVVNLIDTALSNHFGTNLCAKSSNKECTSARSAVEMLKKHSSTAKIDKDLCMEIAQVLTDSFVANSSAPSHCEIKAGSECTCKSQIDEPTFVKQLKQMRWGHLRHIQREVRRLEDLERFLDSCSDSALEKCNSQNG